MTKTVPRNVTIEDEPEPGDPPPRSSPSPPQTPVPPSQNNVSPQQSQSPQIVNIDTPASDKPEFMTQLSYTNLLIRQATMPTLPPDLDDFGIPPSPPGTPSPSLSAKLNNFHQLRERGVYFNDRLGGNKGYRNPKLLEKLRGYVGVDDEYGSHLPASIWNPHGFSQDQFFDKIGILSTMNRTNFTAEKQKMEFEALQTRQLTEQRSSIEFTSTSSNTAQKSAAERIMEGLNSRPNSRPQSRTGGDVERKKSRWDDRRDDRRDDRGYVRDKRDYDRYDGGKPRDRSSRRDHDRSREHDRGRGGMYKDRDDRG